MASGGKKKTTMAKLARENRLRERRQIKKARKDARKREPQTEHELADVPGFQTGTVAGEAAGSEQPGQAPRGLEPDDPDAPEQAPQESAEVAPEANPL